MEAYAQVSLSATVEADALSKAVRGSLLRLCICQSAIIYAYEMPQGDEGSLTLNLHNPCITPPRVNERDEQDGDEHHKPRFPAAA